MPIVCFIRVKLPGQTEETTVETETIGTTEEETTGTEIEESLTATTSESSPEEMQVESETVANVQVTVARTMFTELRVEVNLLVGITEEDIHQLVHSICMSGLP